MEDRESRRKRRPRTAPEKKLLTYCDSRIDKCERAFFPFLKERRRLGQLPSTRQANDPFVNELAENFKGRPDVAEKRRKPSFRALSKFRPKTCSSRISISNSSKVQKSKISLAKWSVPIHVDNKSINRSRLEKQKQRPFTANPKRNRNNFYALRQKESTLSQDVIRLVTQRMLAEKAIPLFDATRSSLGLSCKKDPQMYLSAEEYVESRRKKAEEKKVHRKHRRRQNQLTKKHDMSDVRTHRNIFRPFIAHEQFWLMQWGKSKGNDMRANCHIYRSLEQWDKMKRLARIEHKEKRKERAVANSLGYYRLLACARK